MGSKKTKSSSTAYNMWTSPEGEEVMQNTTGSILGALGNSNDVSGHVSKYVKDTVSGSGMNPYLENLMRGIRSESDINTPSLLAQQRSQYRNSPFAAAQFGTDEALRRNAIGRDNALYSALVPAYESGANRQLQAANLGSTMGNANIAQALQLMDLLKVQQANSQSKEKSMDYAKMIAAVAGVVAAPFTGGASLAATGAAMA